MKSLKVSFFALILLLAFCVSSYAAAPPTVYLNGQKTNLIPLVKGYVNFLQINELSNIISNKVEFNTSTKEAKINNFPVNLKADPIIKNGKIYLPVESIVSAANGTVSYDARTNVLKINTKKSSPSSQSQRPIAIKISPVQTETVIVTKPSQSAPSPTPSSPPQKPVSSEDDDTKPFIPRSATNDIFKVTVTNVEKASVLKGSYSAKVGFKYIVVYFSQQNITDRLQTYAGKFYLIDDNNNKYSWTSGISNYWIVFFRPGGINFGYLTFELPLFSKPVSLYLDLGNKPPVIVALAKEPPSSSDYMFNK